MKGKREKIPKIERDKVEFLTEYRKLCERFDMMVGFTGEDEEPVIPGVESSEYNVFCVVEISEDRAVLDKAIEEMKLEDLLICMPPEENGDGDG